MLDALVLGKAYVTQGIAAAGPLGAGPGPVAHTGWPSQSEAMPWLSTSAHLGAHPPRFVPCEPSELRGVLPVVESVGETVTVSLSVLVPEAEGLGLDETEDVADGEEAGDRLLLDDAEELGETEGLDVEDDEPVLLTAHADATHFASAIAQCCDTGGHRRLRRRKPVLRMLLEMSGGQAGNEIVGLRGMRHDFSRGEVKDHRFGALGAAVDSKVKHGNR